MLRRGSFSSPGGGAAAKVGRDAMDFVAEGLAGERVIGKRYRDFGQLGGEGTVVFRGVEAQSLDVPQQGDPPVQSGLAHVHALQAAEERLDEQVSLLAGLRSGRPAGSPATSAS